MKRFLFYFTIAIAFFSSNHSLCRRMDRDLAPLDIMLTLDKNNYSPLQEGYYRTMLYKLAEKNPHFFKMSSIKDNKEYFTSILKDHIVKLEKKLAENRTGLISKAMFKGSLATLFSIFSGFIFKHFYDIPQKSSADFRGNYYDQYRWEDEKCEALVGCGISTLGCACFAITYFRKAWRHRIRVLERLERDRKILELLESIED